LTWICCARPIAGNAAVARTSNPESVLLIVFSS
jgi:hypothetical protein